MKTSWVYRSASRYDLVMRVLYGRHYRARYQAIADLIPNGVSVVDACCGPAFLFERHLRAKDVDYTGIDINPQFVARVIKLGGKGLVRDLAEPAPLPRADYVVMEASLYQFLPDARGVLSRLCDAARCQVIVAEPIRNLATSGIPVLARLAQRHANAGNGPPRQRFDTAMLDELFQSLCVVPLQRFLIPGGREIVYVLEAGAESSHSVVARGLATGSGSASTAG